MILFFTTTKAIGDRKKKGVTTVLNKYLGGKKSRRNIKSTPTDEE